MAEDLCKDVLLYTQKMVTHTIESQSDYEQFVEKWLKTATYEEYRRMKESGWSADTDFNWAQMVGVDADGDGHMSEEEFKSAQKQLNEGFKLKIKDGKRYREVQETINRHAISAWNTCIAEKYSTKPKPIEDEIPITIKEDVNKEGLCKSITPIGNDKIQVSIWFNTRFNETRPTINQIIVFGGKVIEEESFKEGEIIVDTKVLFVERDLRQALQITIVTSRGNVEHSMPAVNVHQLQLRRFIFQLDLKTIKPDKEYSLKLPAEYKSISAAPPNVDPFGMWPTSLQEWTVRTVSDVNKIDQKFIAMVTAVYDPTDIWDVTIAQNSVDNETECEVKLPDGYLITAGAYQVNVHWRDEDIKPNICEKERLISLYPKDTCTLQVVTLGACNYVENNNPPYTLTAYALGIRSTVEQEIQHKIEITNRDKNSSFPNMNFDIKDSSFTHTGGMGFKNKSVTDPRPGSVPSPVEGLNDANYVIGIKQPTMPIVFIENKHIDL